jgi:uncharacterized membrane protein
MVLGGNVEWIQMGMTPLEMDFEALKDDAARDICIAWGVPHVLIVKGASTFNNISEAKLELYEDTVIPTIDLVASELNNWLTPQFGDGLFLSPDLDSVSALEPRRESKRTSTMELFKSGLLDGEEAREALQYGPRSKDAVSNVDASILTALIASAPDVGMVPLTRYMLSVGLVPAGTSEEDILNAANDLLEDDEDDDIPPPVKEEVEDDDDGLVSGSEAEKQRQMPEVKNALVIVEDKPVPETLADQMARVLSAMPAPNITVQAPNVTVTQPEVKLGDVHVTVEAAKRGTVKKTITGYDDKGRIAEMTEKEVDDEQE